MQILWDINPQEGQNKWSIIESVTEPTNKNKEGFFCYLHPIECTQVCFVYLMYDFLELFYQMTFQDKMTGHIFF